MIAGEQDRGNAAVAGQLINVYLRACTVELQQREQEEFAVRLERLEDALEANGERGSYGS